jgi:hypothetical protein
MGMMDKAKGKMGSMDDEMRDQYERLQQKEMDGDLDDTGKQKLEELRRKFNH